LKAENASPLSPYHKKIEEAKKRLQKNYQTAKFFFQLLENT